MSNFLLNLARRAAGVSSGAVYPPAAAPLADAAGAGEGEAIGAVTELDVLSSGSSPVVPDGAPSPGETPAVPAIQRAPVETHAVPPRGLSPAPASFDRARESDVPVPATRPGLLAPPETPMGRQTSTVVERDRSESGHEPARRQMPFGTAHDASDRALRRPESMLRPAMPAAAQDSPRAVGRITARVDESGSSPALVRPATAGSPMADLPRRAPAAPPVAAAPAPVHVRIGRIEVRDAPGAPPPPLSRPSPAALGFSGYTRLRTYRTGSP